MNVRKGTSYEVAGQWRKDSIEVSDAEFPEVAHLEPLQRVAYIGFRVEQRLALLKWQNGALDDAAYSGLVDQLERLCVGYLGAPDAG